MVQECSWRVCEDASNQRGLCYLYWLLRCGFSSWDLLAFSCDLRQLIGLFGVLSERTTARIWPLITFLNVRQ